MEITEFLLARVGEDEAAARAPRWSRWSAKDDDEVIYGCPLPLDSPQRCDQHEAEGVPNPCDDNPILELDSDFDNVSVLHHVARHDPARVLAQCEAVRRVVELHGDQHDCGDPKSWEYPYVGCATLRALVRVHRDHPDFDPAWEV